MLDLPEHRLDPVQFRTIGRQEDQASTDGLDEHADSLRAMGADVIEDHDVPFSNYASLTRAPQVQELIQAELERVNKKFARVEQIKKFYLLQNQLTAEDDELTPTMKLKRKLVQQKYAPQIEAMYQA